MPMWKLLGSFPHVGCLEVSFEKETVYICGECSQGLENETNCIDHVKAHKSKCYKCEFDTTHLCSSKCLSEFPSNCLSKFVLN